MPKDDKYSRKGRGVKEQNNIILIVLWW